jgi:hypothetical protein
LEFTPPSPRYQMARLFKKYFYCIIVLLSAWGYRHAHAGEKSAPVTSIYAFESICIDPHLQCNDPLLGHGHSGKAFRDRITYLTEENFEAVYKSSAQKQPQSFACHFAPAYVRMSRYLLALPLISEADHHSVYVKLSLYILLRSLLI